MPPESDREPLPFEPRQKSKKKKKAKATPPPTASVREKKSDSRSKRNANSSAIPEVVSQRMIRRMALMCGIPTGLGLSSFFIFYAAVSQGWAEIPPQLVFYATLGLFGLGFFGLSYGVLSTSWEEDRPGGWIGWQEFTLNAARLLQGWRTARQAAKEAKEN
ncbi:MAG: PAM68 family protein [Cyanobacteria bacterium SBLK]|nr:PAM68 family protein [Cyanobacteria bacterium SBLK]